MACAARRWAVEGWSSCVAYIVPWLGVTEKAADAPAKKSQRKGANVLTSFTTAMSVTDVCLGDERRENVSSGALPPQGLERCSFRGGRGRAIAQMERLVGRCAMAPLEPP